MAIFHQRFGELWRLRDLEGPAGKRRDHEPFSKRNVFLKRVEQLHDMRETFAGGRRAVQSKRLGTHCNHTRLR